jgi:hypothetical protein
MQSISNFWDHKLHRIVGILNPISHRDILPVQFELVKENLETTKFPDYIWMQITSAPIYAIYFRN